MPEAPYSAAMFKHCPACGGEFQPWVSRCPDCDVALELGSGTPAPARRSSELPPARELTCLEKGDPRALHEIAERLQAQGLSSRIDVYPPDGAIRPPARRGSGEVSARFGLYVRPAEIEAARRIRSDHLREVVPDAASPEGDAGAALAACPACGAELDDSAAACAACGLEFPELAADE